MRYTYTHIHSNKMLRPIIVKVSVLGYFPLSLNLILIYLYTFIYIYIYNYTRFGRNCMHNINQLVDMFTWYGIYNLCNNVLINND